MSYEESKSRMSFGNILLSLLLLGTITVIGLIVLVYFKLTNPSERTQVAPVSVSAPVRPVEKLVPNGATVVSASAATATSATASPSNVRQPPLLIPYSGQNANNNKDADDATNALNADNQKFNSRALNDGAAAPKKPVRRRNPATQQQPENAENGTRNRRHQAAATGETPLQPTNVPQERTLTPRNTSSNQNNDRPRRTYTAPQRNAEPQQGERVLTPNRPARRNTDVDALF